MRLARPAVRLDDVAGMEAVKRQIRLRMIEPLQHPEEAKKHGSTLVRLRRGSVSALERELIRVTSEA